MITEQRRPTTNQPVPAKRLKRPRSSSSPSRAANAAEASLHNSQSPLLALPAELRNRIYELVVGGNFVHVEAQPRQEGCRPSSPREATWREVTGTETAHLTHWKKTRCIHYYICKAPISEGEAYCRSQDASLCEQLPGDAELVNNCWRVGDAHHIDPCRERHQACCPPSPGVQAADLHDSLLGLLRACKQIYHEVRYMPMAVNTFSFEDVLALFFFLVLLTPAQRRSLRSLHLFWCTGVDQNRFSGSNRWNNWLSAPNLLDWLSGVRVLHVSVTIGCESELHGPLVTALTRSTYYDSTINTWVFGLKRFRKLPLEKVTVIVSDDPGSRFGKTRGHAQHGNGWLLLRQRYCLTAHEKRTTAQNLRSEILKQTVEDGGANPV